MKRAVLFMTCVLASLMMSAQGTYDDFDYVPFVKEGKTWHVIRSEFEGGHHYEYYKLMNEKVVNAGKTFMKMYWSVDFLDAIYDLGLLREENRKVYFFDYTMQKEFLLFDYSLKTGDTYETYSYDEQKVVSYKVLSVDDYTEGPEVYDYVEEADSMETRHRYLRKWTVGRTDDNSFQKMWIEGIGSLEGPLANLYDERPVSSKNNLAYVEYDNGDYLPFSFHNGLSHVHGCNLPTGAENLWDDDRHHKLTYELEGNRLHVYGEAFTNCGPNNYAYFYESKTDDPLVNKIKFVIENASPSANCMALHATNFYVTGFDPNMNYIVVDVFGEEHPVVNKTPQMAYRPLVEEGKVWKVGTISGNPVQVVDYYYFDGDTIIGGKTCKQMMCQRFVSPEFSDEYWTPTPSLSKVGAWYEEDKRVYFYDENKQAMVLKYDFSVDANDTLLINDLLCVIGQRQTGGIEGFKGVYRHIMTNQSVRNIIWLEGVGVLDAPFRNVYDPRADLMPEFLMSCTVGDEVIYLNDGYEDGATPEEMNARKQRIDFTHIIKTQPKTRMRQQAGDAEASETSPLYGEYNERLLDINLDPLNEAYLVLIADETGKAVYEKTVNAGNIVGLNIDISSYVKGHYTVTVENIQESFTGEFEVKTTGIEEVRSDRRDAKIGIFDLQGRRLTDKPNKGVYIQSGRLVVK